jgi:DNA-directed RNA polymerase subunit RPC12/RpoP
MRHNWHWAEGTALVNTLTKQAWDCRHWDVMDWEMFNEGFDEMQRWDAVREMEQLNGPCICPRCRHAMDPRRPALSRLTRMDDTERIYVCSPCGSEEAILQFHNKGIAVDWRTQ